MNWNLFRMVWWCGLALICLQAVCAVQDGWLTQAYLQHQGVTGYSFMEHGGMWVDVLIVSPLVAYIIAKYRLAYTAWYSVTLFILAGGTIIGAGYNYAKGEAVMLPDAYVHDGITTAAGWIHLIFAVVALYCIAMFYAAPLHPSASRREITVISLLLTLFFLLGICKFSDRWEFSDFAKRQISIELSTLWVVTTFKLLQRR